ncbi:MAG TPA: hypothetical protein VEB86_14625 [Chryseosolibacter sp.]|nr:hypothetical protein [Chryseosolibacter sp.]
MSNAFKRSIFALALMAMALASCEPVPENVFTRRFVIKEGSHYSTPRLAEMLQSNRLRFEATFDQSAIYDFNDQAMQTNKNKLMGFADCNSMHHENSARFGWQWYNNQLEIYAYCYVNGNRVEEFLGTVQPGVVNNYEIELTADAYVFYLNNEQITSIGRSVDCDKGAYYLLYPYFGGSLPAPHDVTIDITMIR